MKGKYLRRKFFKLQKNFQSLIYETRRRYDKAKLKNHDFSIISNNCWAGKVYQYFDMPYLTPTVGLYFFAEDYIKFVYDLKFYISQPLQFIAASDSKYAEILIERNHTSVPIARLADIEIVFLHYADEKEAFEKWNRRKERINWDNIIIKFSRMNGCSDDIIYKFLQLPFKNKFCFDFMNRIKSKNVIISDFKNDGIEIILDTKPFPGSISVTKLLNNFPERY